MGGAITQAKIAEHPAEAPIRTKMQYGPSTAKERPKLLHNRRKVVKEKEKAVNKVKERPMEVKQAKVIIRKARKVMLQTQPQQHKLLNSRNQHLLQQKQPKQCLTKASLEVH